MGSFIEIHSEHVGDVGFFVNDTYENISKKLQNILNTDDNDCLVINSNNNEDSPCNFIIPKYILETGFIVVSDDPGPEKESNKDKNSKKVIKLISKK